MKKHIQVTSLVIAVILILSNLPPQTFSAQEPVTTSPSALIADLPNYTTPQAIIPELPIAPLAVVENFYQPIMPLSALDRGTYHINIVAGNQITTRGIANKPSTNPLNQTFFISGDGSEFLVNFAIASRWGRDNTPGRPTLASQSRYNVGGISQWEVVNPLTVPSGITINFLTTDTLDEFKYFVYEAVGVVYNLLGEVHGRVHRFEVRGTTHQVGTHLIPIRAVQSGSTWREHHATIALHVRPQPTLPAQVMHDALIGQAYSYAVRHYTLDAQGHQRAERMHWWVIAGTLPPGLSLDANTGVISGTPAGRGQFDFTIGYRNSGLASGQAGNSFVRERLAVPAVTATPNANFGSWSADRQITLSLYVGDGSPRIQTTTLASGTINSPYSQTLVAGGNPVQRWELIGLLPPGLTLNQNNGVISGTPTADGNFRFSVRAVNAQGNHTVELGIHIGASPPSIPAQPLTQAYVGQPYMHVMNAQGTGPFAWGVSAGALPPGLFLTQNTGAISGTPTTTGTWTFTLQAAGPGGSTTRQFTMSVLPALPQITTPPLIAGQVGQLYSATIVATGTQPIYFSIAGGELPPGLVMSAVGVISGVPTVNGAFNFTVEATNPAGTHTANFSITVLDRTAPILAPRIVSTHKPHGVVGQSFDYQLVAAGTAPMQWVKLTGIVSQHNTA